MQKKLKIFDMNKGFCRNIRFFKQELKNEVNTSFLKSEKTRLKNDAPSY